MKTIKKASAGIICILLIFSLFLMTGCSFIESFKDNLESRREERKENSKRSFSEMHGFQDYYLKEITKAMKGNDKKALKDLFCETVLENTYDIDEGLEYVFGREDWSGFSMSNGNCSSRKEYGGEGHWEYVNCTAVLSKDKEQYRIFYSGYSTYEWKVDGKKRTVSENLGLAAFCIIKLDSKGSPAESAYTLISGINHPGREKFSDRLNLVLNYYDSKEADGSYKEEMTDEALASIMTDNLQKNADKDELKAFIKFIRTGSISKKHEYFTFLRKQGSSVTLTATVRFELKDRCLTLLIKDGQIDGASFSADKNEEKPRFGRIEGFSKDQ
ncbi:MAG: DUF5104 domain-containing protein [Clostridiales bacterium]|nr:DUF5104 domain-containing protein [Clostridiales bacterium]